MASICGSPVCAGGKPKMKFTYTGDYVVRKDGVVELLTSGTIVFLEPKIIDVFMVGGGGGGGNAQTSYNSQKSTGGGGGGYTRTYRKLAVANNASYNITVGAGGAEGVNGGASAFGANITVSGGNAGVNASGSGTKPTNGGNGGSGGGAGVINNSDYGAGGSDGANGENSNESNYYGGTGQGFTTREFNEAAGKLYSGGGGGGRYTSGLQPVISMGGSGGGGAGGWYHNPTNNQAASAGGANTGGGGGGAAAIINGHIAGGSGGSGIVCFREAQELPELAGTWVLNERLYAPENEFTETVSFTAGPTTGSEFNYARVNYNGEDLRFGTVTQYTTIYRFSSGLGWSNKYKTIIFPAGATASDEFRAWLASNATKQA